jgi:adenylate cyclase
VLSVKNYNESILKSTSNGMVTLDGEEIISYANDAALSILKIEHSELVDRPAEKFFCGENAWVMSAVKRVEETGQQDVSVDASLKIGEANIGVNMTATPLIGLDMEPIGTIIVFEDITEEKRVKATMSRFMSKEVADQVLAAAESELGGKDQVISILFSDIRQFTTIAEAMGARETVSMLNEYFSEMADVIEQHSGNVDKYIGDAIMALFGAPFRRPHDADNAVAAANEMLMKLRSLNQRRTAQGKDAIDIGVGVATGDVIIGTIGSQKRMDYTAIGDSVNLASRLEGANKYYGSKILVSESTVRAMKNATPMREIDLIRVKGKDRAIAVYEVLGYHDATTFPLLDEGIERFNLGLAAYRAKDWQTAIAQFETVLRIQPGDGPSDMYVKRCLHYRENPPPQIWDGVWVLTDK